jgi:hypothetical protein
MIAYRRRRPFDVELAGRGMRQSAAIFGRDNFGDGPGIQLTKRG